MNTKPENCLSTVIKCQVMCKGGNTQDGSHSQYDEIHQYTKTKKKYDGNKTLTISSSFKEEFYVQRRRSIVTRPLFKTTVHT